MHKNKPYLWFQTIIISLTSSNANTQLANPAPPTDAVILTPPSAEPFVAESVAATWTIIRAAVRADLT